MSFDPSQRASGTKFQTAALPNGKRSNPWSAAGRRAPTGLVLEIEITERLSGGVADDEAGVIDRPGRREAARGGHDHCFAQRRCG